MQPFEWRCPFCGHHQIVTDANIEYLWRFLDIGKSKFGNVGLIHKAIRCVNLECSEVYISIEFTTSELVIGRGQVFGNTLKTWSLRPESSSKTQPDYIPDPLREDYYEACLVRDMSPKASATLSRRCLQGMIRDFCGISKARLIDEIKELRSLSESGRAPKGVELEAIEAIDAIRDIGNIGAHMEKDISLIVDVDPGEAQALIELIEMLFDEWYVARHKREQKLAAVKAIAAEKKAAIEEGRAEIARAKAAPADGTLNME